MKTGIELIAAERQRQITKERWTPEHDDAHSGHELARAAAFYVKHYVSRAWIFENDGPELYPDHEAPKDEWPWARKWWKPSDPMRDLVKAGALIAAEIDRLQRKASASNS
jgi:hypothetical protein